MLWGPVSTAIMELEASKASAAQHHDEALLREDYETAKRMKERLKDLARALAILHPINQTLR